MGENERKGMIAINDIMELKIGNDKKIEERIDEQVNLFDSV